MFIQKRKLVHRGRETQTSEEAQTPYPSELLNIDFSLLWKGTEPGPDVCGAGMLLKVPSWVLAPLILAVVSRLSALVSERDPANLTSSSCTLYRRQLALLGMCMIQGLRSFSHTGDWRMTAPADCL